MGASFINQRASIQKAKALVASMTKANRAERAVARDPAHREPSARFAAPAPATLIHDRITTR